MMVRIDSVLVNFFKTMTNSRKITFQSLNNKNFINNIFIPSEYIILNLYPKDFTFIVSINSKQDDVFNDIMQMFNCLSSINKFEVKRKMRESDTSFENKLNNLKRYGKLSKSNNKYYIEYDGVPVISDDKKIDAARLVGNVVDVNLIDMNSDVNIYEFTVSLRMIK